MLTRVVLGISDSVLRRRLRGLLERAQDTVVEALTGKARLWERATRESCDVLVVSESAIPEPVAASIQLPHDTPSSPAVVVISCWGIAVTRPSRAFVFRVRPPSPG